MSFNYILNIPNPPNNPSSDVPIMQTNANSIAGIIAVDHIGFNATPGGYHNVIHFFNKAADPAKIAGVGQEYTKTVAGDQQLFYESGNGIITQLTGPNAAVASLVGYTWLPGAILLQWGILSAASQTSTAVTFASLTNIPFPNNCFVVIPGINAASTMNANVLNISAVSKTGFTYYNTSSSTRNYYYIAIGN